eukprot:GHVN01013730.1.p1 GENE.GHVN01013730.1~~GHVN01013730.1.p1  ORF type:complete len:1058 (-),score=161.15 GHVN01013730.1:875-4048(-)
MFEPEEHFVDRSLGWVSPRKQRRCPSQSRRSLLCDRQRRQPWVRLHQQQLSEVRERQAELSEVRERLVRERQAPMANINAAGEEGMIECAFGVNDLRELSEFEDRPLQSHREKLAESRILRFLFPCKGGSRHRTEDGELNFMESLVKPDLRFTHSYDPQSSHTQLSRRSDSTSTYLTDVSGGNSCLSSAVLPSNPPEMALVGVHGAPPHDGTDYELLDNTTSAPEADLTPALGPPSFVHLYLPDGKQNKPTNNFDTSEEVLMSNRLRTLIKGVDVVNAMKACSEGREVVKYCRPSQSMQMCCCCCVGKGRKHSRFFFIDEDLLALRWHSPKKNHTKSGILLSTVERIVPGFDSDFWGSKKPEGTNPQDMPNFGIELVNPRRALRIELASFDEWRTWITALLHHHHAAIQKRVRSLPFTADFVRRQWDMSDLDESGTVCRDEVLKMLRRMNFGVDKTYVDELIDEFDVDESGVIDYQEFSEMMSKLLTQPDVQELFNVYCDDRTHLTMTPTAYTEFLKDIQKCSESEFVEEIEKIRTLPDTHLTPAGELTATGFNSLLMSNANSLVHPICNTVYQDMTKPLSHYWIASSHNTYLLGDQLTGTSAVSQYIDALLKGCRCVELDCWDGSKGEPVIYHGHTLTSKIPLEPVIQACKDYAFQRSPYPVILSMEMHCKPEQIGRIGEILVKILGNSIYIPEPGKPMASPEDLQYKFLIKDHLLGVEIDDNEEDDAQYIGLSRAINKAADASKEAEGKLFHANTEVRKDADDPAAIYYNTISLTLKKWKIADLGERGILDFANLSETKFRDLVKEQRAMVSYYTARWMFRVYPKGTRMRSGNFNPCFAWNSGGQVAAMNYQFLGPSMLINIGRFADNGNCGFVLKPPILCQMDGTDPDNLFDPTDPRAGLIKYGVEGFIIHITIVSAHQLPRPNLDTKRDRKSTVKAKDCSDPFVVLTCHGLPCDEAKFKSSAVMRNGFNPRWKDESFTFSVAAPSLAVLLLEIRDKDSVGSDFLAAAAIPVNRMRTGLRWCSLYDSQQTALETSGLLVHVSIEKTIPGCLPRA